MSKTENGVNAAMAGAAAVPPAVSAVAGAVVGHRRLLRPGRCLRAARSVAT